MEGILVGFKRFATAVLTAGFIGGSGLLLTGCSSVGPEARPGEYPPEVEAALAAGRAEREEKAKTTEKTTGRADDPSGQVTTTPGPEPVMLPVPAPVEPVVPKDIGYEDQQGFETFAKWVLELFTYTKRSGNTEILGAIQATQCKACDELINAVNADNLAGKRIADGSFTILKIYAPERLDTKDLSYVQTFKVKVNGTSTVSIEATQYQENQIEVEFRVGAIFQNRHWRLTGFGGSTIKKDAQ